MQPKTCCVIGYGEIPFHRRDHVKRMLEWETNMALKAGYNTFLAENREGAGAFFAWQIAGRRGELPEIFLELVVTRRCEKIDPELLSRCNAVKTLCDSGRRGYLLSVTRYLIGQADRVIVVYAKGAARDTAYAVNYARVMERELRFIKTYNQST